MVRRSIIEIDRDKCNGCGLCTTACAEGALALDEENKAYLVREIYCDGMGACLDVCPTGALKIIEKETVAYDPEATLEHVARTRGAEAARHVHGARPGTEASRHAPGRTAALCSCPGSTMVEIPEERESGLEEEPQTAARSELRQWPIQLHLVSPYAPYFEGCDLLIAADCTAFSLGSFHQTLLKGKKLIIACPKLDETENYVEKLAEIIRHNKPSRLTVAIMSVPCCSSLYRMVEQAVKLSGVDLIPERFIVSLDGKISR
ncbi:MAG: 4Fe-4S dicluster domain-containing protein [Candidatus Saccharicenans sp.]|nr:4Fe-4S dicluster domain-containing protein [Candidatus Saccharicenans sp.]